MKIDAGRFERERDEAREDAEHWKTEYEIVADRLRGKKHERDNGIIAEDEIIPKLTRERDEAREKIKRQAARICQLEGATCHAGGTPLSIALRERNEAREALADWENAAAHVEADHPDEKHCGCVPVLRKLLTDALKDRDEWAAMCGRYKQERDEVRALADDMAEKAKELITRWDQPSWKDTAPTAGFIYALRDAVQAYEKRQNY